MKILFASDHAGLKLKDELLRFVRDELHHVVQDCGAHTLNPDDDYPDFISLAAKAVSDDPYENRAVILGGSGQGEAMMANRFPNVRATVYYGGSLDIIRFSREHNDANILSLGARFLSTDEARNALKLWLDTPFSKGVRHARRIRKIETRSA